MKTFKQYISEAGTWGPLLSPWLPYPNSGGKNVVTPGSMKPPKKPAPTSVRRHELVRDGGRLYELPTDDYPDTQQPLRRYDGDLGDSPISE